MKKNDISCDVKNKYIEFDESEKYCTILAKISWNNKKPKGLDIRKYDKVYNKVYKGINISDKGLDILTKKLIELGYGKDKFIKDESEEKIFDNNDFDKMFKDVKEASDYVRDNYGILRDNDGHAIILKRR